MDQKWGEAHSFTKILIAGLQRNVRVLHFLAEVTVALTPFRTLPPEDRVLETKIPPIPLSELAPVILNIQTPHGLIPLSYEDRPFLKQIVDAFPVMRKVFFLFGRQTEKTVYEREEILLSDNSVTEIRNIQVGDRVAAMGPSGARTAVGEVTWKSRRYRKKCLRVRTRQGHVSRIGVTHPVRQWERWAEAGGLAVGDRVASVRQVGEFLGTSSPEDSVVEYCGFMIADGQCHRSPITTKLPSLVREHFINLVEPLGWITPKGLNNPTKISMSSQSGARYLLEEWGLWGEKSAGKFVPDFVFRLDRRQTALFLNRLWSCNGHVSQPKKTQYEIVYGTISYRLARDVQRLLWKFGVPTVLREQTPKVYEGTDKRHYLLRVETRAGIRTFLEEIGALGKSEGVPLPEAEENSNRDTYPLEIEHTLRRIRESRTTPERDGVALYQSGHDLRWRPKYPLTPTKLGYYIEFFRKGPYDQSLVDELEVHLTTDLYWDEITEIEDIGEQWCYDISVEGTESFVAGGVVTHNSTTLAAMPLLLSTIQRLTVQYTSGTLTQAQEFSHWKIDGFIKQSDFLKNIYDIKGNALLYNRREKESYTGSRILVGTAFGDAARIRGVPADWLEMDELELVQIEVVPVLQHALHHSPYKYELHAATPLSTDNTAWIYWDKYSVQHEWMLPCNCVKHVTGVGPRGMQYHWNILGPRNLSIAGPICDKCGNLIDTMQGRWVRTTKTKDEDSLRSWNAFRFPQLAAPYTDYVEIVTSLEQRPIETMQESFALSVTEARQVFSDALIETLASPDLVNEEDHVMERGGVYPYFVGVDWGGGGRAATAIVFGAYINDVFNFMGGFRYFDLPLPVSYTYDMNAEVEGYVPFVHLLRRVTVLKAGADAGMGYIRNRMLLNILGPERFFAVNYSGTTIDLLKLKPYDLVVSVSRDNMLTNFITALKLSPHKFRLPRMQDLKRDHWYQDIKAVKAEQDKKGRIHYVHPENETDDLFHAMFNCMLASHLVYPRSDLFPSAAFSLTK